MLRGKVHAGGWEINAIGMTVFLVRKPVNFTVHGCTQLTHNGQVTLTILVLLVAVDSRK